jgi:hypothetical protein
MHQVFNKGAWKRNKERISLPIIIVEQFSLYLRDRSRKRGGFCLFLFIQKKGLK